MVFRKKDFKNCFTLLVSLCSFSKVCLSDYHVLSLKFEKKRNTTTDFTSDAYFEEDKSDVTDLCCELSLALNLLIRFRFVLWFINRIVSIAYLNLAESVLRIPL